MKLRTIAEHNVDWRTIGKPSGSDVIQSVPDDNTLSDSKDALKHAKNGDIPSALLSLISKVPKVGEMVQQGVQHLGNSEEVQKYLLQHADSVAKVWPKVKDGISTLKEWQSFVGIFEKVVSTLTRLQTKMRETEVAER